MRHVRLSGPWLEKLASPHGYGAARYALFFEERVLHKEDSPLLSCSDIIALPCHYLPRRDVSEKEVFRQMQVRHERRQAAIDAAYKKQDTEGLLSATG